MLMAALTLGPSLRADEIDAPEPLQNQTSAQMGTAESSTQSVVEGAAAQDTTNPAAPQAPSPQVPALTSKGTQSLSGDQESHERVLGLAPTFYVVNDASKARALTVREKWRLFYRQTYDPYQFAATGIGAGISQAENDSPGYGQGMQGYAKRYGSQFADTSLGAFFGNFLLPSLLHDDPRYFRAGSGPFMHRLLHAAGSALITHRDNGTRRTNYSNILGNFIGCGFGNLYYAKEDRGVGTTFERGATVTGAGALGAVFLEFWPDIHNKLFKKNKSAK